MVKKGFADETDQRATKQLIKLVGDFDKRVRELIENKDRQTKEIKEMSERHERLLAMKLTSTDREKMKTGASEKRRMYEAVCKRVAHLVDGTKEVKEKTDVAVKRHNQIKEEGLPVIDNCYASYDDIIEFESAAANLSERRMIFKKQLTHAKATIQRCHLEREKHQAILNEETGQETEAAKHVNHLKAQLVQKQQRVVALQHQKNMLVEAIEKNEAEVNGNHEVIKKERVEQDQIFRKIEAAELMLQSNSNESRTLELLKVKSVLSGLLSEVVETIDDREEKQLLEKITYINDQLQLAISRGGGLLVAHEDVQRTVAIKEQQKLAIGKKQDSYNIQLKVLNSEIELLVSNHEIQSHEGKVLEESVNSAHIFIMEEIKRAAELGQEDHQICTSQMVLESNATCLSKQKTDVDLKVLELEKQMKSLADENANLSNILFLKAQEFSIEEKRSIDLRQSTEEDSQEWNRKVGDSYKKLESGRRNIGDLKEKSAIAAKEMQIKTDKVMRLSNEFEESEISFEPKEDQIQNLEAYLMSHKNLEQMEEELIEFRKVKCAELDQSRSRIEELRVTQRRQNWAIQEIKHKKVVFVAKQEKYQKIRARTEMMGQELGKLKQGCVSIKKMDQLIGVRGIVSGRDNEGFKKPKAMPKRTKK